MIIPILKRYSRGLAKMQIFATSKSFHIITESLCYMLYVYIPSAYPAIANDGDGSQ